MRARSRRAALGDVPGARLVTDFVTEDEAADLREQVYDLAKRTVSQPGIEFRFLGFRPVWLIKRVMCELRWRHPPTEVFGNVYGVGRSLALHSDGTDLAGDGVANLTVGTGTPFKLREPIRDLGGFTINDDNSKRDVDVWLPPRSLLVLTGESAITWAHGFDPLPEQRISVILRRGKRY